ncbi:Protein of unknown function [Pyronema omphalodes CBS 100304]|nr:Protein of unknown function [Pyronema omphalodes CBS 100304]
MAKTFCQ